MFVLGGALVLIPLIFGGVSDGSAIEHSATVTASDSFYYSHDGGITFTPGVFAEIARVEVFDVAFSETHSFGVAVTSAGVFVSSNNGEIWEPLKKSVADFSGMRLQAVAVDETNASVYISGHTSNAAYVYYSSNSLSTLDKIYESPDGVRAQDIVSRGQVAYMGMSDGHILLYNSFSETFEGFGSVDGEISDIVVRDGVVYAATRDKGMYATFDGGARWKQILADQSQKLPGAANIYSLEGLGSNGALLYAASGVGLLQIANYGKTLTVLDSVVPEQSPLSAVAVAQSGIIYAAKENVVYKSADGGRRWIILSPFESGKEIAHIMTNSTGETVYIIVGVLSAQKPAFKLLDIGRTFRALGR